MRSDKELLELAAKAAGVKVFIWGSKGAEKFRLKRADDCPGEMWNPLTDDGDALRLASALELDIMYRVVGGNRVEVLPAGGPLTVIRYIDDRAAATRRAIVDAAASVGAKRFGAQAAEPTKGEK